MGYVPHSSVEIDGLEDDQECMHIVFARHKNDG